MKIGFAINNLGVSQLSYSMLSSVNAYLEDHYKVNFIAFYEHLHPAIITPNFASMQIDECWGFDGMLVGTSLSTARKVMRSPEPTSKVFYVWDLEWLRPKMPYNSMLASIYRDELVLVARSEEHKAAIEDVWNVKVRKVIPNFDAKLFVELCEELEND